MGHLQLGTVVGDRREGKVCIRGRLIKVVVGLGSKFLARRQGHRRPGRRYIEANLNGAVVGDGLATAQGEVAERDDKSRRDN